MSSNLFKSYYLNRNTDNARIINSNEAIAHRLEQIGMVMPQVERSSDGFEPVNLFEESSVVDPADVLSGEYNQGEEGTPGSDPEVRGRVDGFLAKSAPTDPSVRLFRTGLLAKLIHHISFRIC